MKVAIIKKLRPRISARSFDAPGVLEDRASLVALIERYDRIVARIVTNTTLVRRCAGHFGALANNFVFGVQFRMQFAAAFMTETYVISLCY